jgi:ribose transport system permease protein
MSTLEATSGGTGRRTAWRWVARQQSRFPLVQLVVLAGVYVYGTATLPGLSSWLSIKTILILGALAALVSVGQTMLILMGGFDMSVAGFTVAGTMVLVLPGLIHVSFAVAVLIIIAFAAVVGGLAGWICHRLELSPLIVTLGTGAIALGMSQVVVGSFQFANGTGAPVWLAGLTSPVTKSFGVSIPPVVVIAVVVLLLMAVFLHRTVIGRRLLATGSNPGAAELSLLRTRRIWTGSFAFSAVMSSLFGMVLAGYSGAVDLSIGDPYLFLSVTAVFVGGTVFGGPGDYTRTVVGALFLEVLSTVLIGHGVGAAAQQILYGVILLLAVTAYGRGARLRDRI